MTTGLTDAICQGLGRYSIDEKLRSMRLHKGMVWWSWASMRALRGPAERGKLFPTLPTLLRIATVFGVGLDSFFSDELKRRSVGVVRRAERVRLPDRPVAEDVQYV
jgi:hypothetical protein